jgi:hypothetical protein
MMRQLANSERCVRPRERACGQHCARLAILAAFWHEIGSTWIPKDLFVAANIPSLLRWQWDLR